MMSLALNARKWCECSGDELWAINLRRPHFVAKDDVCHRRGGNQALKNVPRVWSEEPGLKNSKPPVISCCCTFH